MKKSFQQKALHQDSTEPSAVSVRAEPIVLNLAYDSNNSNDADSFKSGLPNFPAILPALTLPAQPMSAAKSPVLICRIHFGVRHVEVIGPYLKLKGGG